jgi:hypothetical protein
VYIFYDKLYTSKPKGGFVTEKLFPREQFETIVKGCLSVLEKYGFTPQPVVQTDLRFSEIFEKNCFGWFGGLSPKPKVAGLPTRQLSLTLRELNHLTLECALVFVKHGVKDVHYNESLNTIRMTIVNALEEMRYDTSKSHYFAWSAWGCYKLWEEVARVEGLDEQEITQFRKWSKENIPQHYEAA